MGVLPIPNRRRQKVLETTVFRHRQMIQQLKTLLANRKETNNGYYTNYI